MAFFSPLDWIAHRYEAAGQLRAPARLLRRSNSHYARRLRGLVGALEQDAIAGLFPAPRADAVQAFSRRALMVLYESPPWRNNGYTVRSASLLKALAEQGIECTAVTRPNFPNDLAVFRDRPVADSESADGLTYQRPRGSAALWEGPLDAYLDLFADRLVDLARSRGASVIHAASNYVCGLAAALAARRLGVRAVYEIRGLWHWSTASKRPGWERSEVFALHEALERQAALQADRVIVLSQALADHVARWGIARDRIMCVGNGVDLDRFRPVTRDQNLRTRWGASAETFVVGYVGTMTAYEGLEDLVEAVGLMRAEGIDAMAVLAGDGEAEPMLRRVASRTQAPVRFIGRIPHQDVPRTLAAFDCCPFPRRASGSPTLVPPLKLGEAMACGVPVAVVDLPPLTEMALPGERGWVFKPGARELADALMRIRAEEAEHRRIADAARAWIVAERSWAKLASVLVASWTD